MSLDSFNTCTFGRNLYIVEGLLLFRIGMGVVEKVRDGPVFEYIKNTVSEDNSKKSTCLQNGIIGNFQVY